MRRNSQIDLFTVIGAASIGTVLGLAVGLMVAPKSGFELRDDIASKGKDLYRKAKHKKDDFEDDFEDFKYDFEETLDDGLEEVEDFIDENMDKIKRK